MRTTPPSFLVMGDVGGADTFHVGDEAMLQADVALIRGLVPDARITVTSAEPAFTSRLLGCAAVAPDRANAELTATDVAVIAGGGNLSPSWPEHVAARVALGRAARRAGTPLLVLGQTIGPDLTPDVAVELRELLQSAQLVGVREATSAAIALRLGVQPARVLEQADDALFLPAGRARHGDARLVVTIHPFAPLDSPAMSGLATMLRGVAARHQLSLLFVPHDRGYRGTDPVSDVEVAETLATLTGGDTVPVPLPSDAVALTRDARVVVSTRYHPLVFAAAACVPALALPCDAYTATKCLGALAHVGLVPWSLGLARAADGALAPALDELVLRAAEIETWLRGRLPRLKALEQHRVAAVSRVLADAGIDVEPISANPPIPQTAAGAPEPRGPWYPPEVDELTSQFWNVSGATAERLATERASLAEALEAAEGYARSLEEHLAVTREARADAETYAKSLEAERAARSSLGTE